MYHTEYVPLRLSAALLQALDEKRGGVARSRYIRTLIERDIKQTEQSVSHPEVVRPAPTPTFTPPEPAAVSPNETRHLHRYKKGNEIVRHDRGTPLYLHTCGCGDVKVDR